jgi:hypothetical protein
MHPTVTGYLHLEVAVPDQPEIDRKLCVFKLSFIFVTAVAVTSVRRVKRASIFAHPNR